MSLPKSNGQYLAAQLVVRCKNRPADKQTKTKKIRVKVADLDAEDAEVNSFWFKKRGCLTIF